jgi:hypothetical protein
MGAPFLLIAPRRWRHAGAIALAGFASWHSAHRKLCVLQLAELALCLPVLDDRFFPQRWRERLSPAPASAWPRWPTAVALISATVAFVLTLPGFFQAFQPRPPNTLAELRSFNGYGLFRVMTTERPEVVIEGSNDGVTWNEYEFPWKPGDLRRASGSGCSAPTARRLADVVRGARHGGQRTFQPPSDGAVVRQSARANVARSA